MAYMNQNKKRIIKAALDKIFKPRGIKYSLRVRDNMAINCTIKAAPIDFIGNFLAKNGDKYRHRLSGNFDHLQVNLYWINEHFTGEAAQVLSEAAEALKAAGYYDNSNAQIDYFDTAYYMYLDIGRYNKPFQFTGNFMQHAKDNGRLEFITIGANHV
jgi:hypothetical protein